MGGLSPQNGHVVKDEREKRSKVSVLPVFLWIFSISIGV